jgi:Cys-rich protein (TIGR01571 family)
MRPHRTGGGEYVSAETPRSKRSDRRPMLRDSSLQARDLDDGFSLHARDFVRGKWEVELSDWSAHCMPNGWMVCVCPCVSIAQISVRIGVDSFAAALAKQLAFHAVVWSLIVLELVYCYRYVSAIFGNGTESTTTPPIVIYSACVTVAIVSVVWVRSLAQLRTRVRERFNIAGSTTDDTCAMAWCTSCAIAQMATQVKSYTPGSCAFRAPDALPPYIP